MKISAVILPLIFGFILDLIIGDPYNMPHPIRLIGGLIGALDKKFKHNRINGAITAVIVILLSAGIPFMILFLLYRINIWLYIIAKSIMIYYILAARSLQKESMKVYYALKKSVEDGQKAVSMIVGRDTEKLDYDGVIRAAVETVAENTSDGVTAPMLYTAVFGAAGGFLYKAVNTMDSMIGYKNEKYIDFGRFAAKLDDVLNFIPSRLTALLMILSSYIMGMDGKNAYKIWKRDRRKHASPNSAQTEAVCAGALDIQLAGDAWYFGELHKKDTIGDALRPIKIYDIKKANSLMYCTAFLFLTLSVIIRILIFEVFK